MEDGGDDWWRRSNISSGDGWWKKVTMVGGGDGDG